MVDLRTHRILKADIPSESPCEFPVAIPLLLCSFELERLIGTPTKPGTPDGVVHPFPSRLDVGLDV
jgi:hypothetical protein